MISALNNYRNGFIAYLVYQIFWLYGGCLLKVGNKTITYSMGMTLYFLILYWIKNHQNNFKKIPFPYKIPFIFLILSAFLTCFTSVAGFGNEFTRAISNILQDIIIVWLIWRVIKTKQDFRKLYKYTTYVMFFACIYGLLEFLFKENILLNYKNTLMGGNIGIYSADFARGYRICSFFEHPIGAGLSFAMYFITTFSLFIKWNIKIPNKNFALLTAILCVPCALLTKMRSVLLFMIISSLIFVNFKSKRFFKFIVYGIIVLFLIAPLLGENINVFLSLFNLNKLITYTNTGSSLIQRLNQFKAVGHLMLMSPIGGLGELFKEYVFNQYTQAALSYESIWLEQMAKHGLVGVIANIILMFYTTIVIPSRYKTKECFWWSLAYWIIYTLSSIPSFRTVLYYTFMFYLIKNSKVYFNIQNNKNLIKLSKTNN